MKTWSKSSFFSVITVSVLVGLFCGSVFTYLLLDPSTGNIIEKRFYVEESQTIEAVDKVEESVLSVVSVRGEVQVSAGSGFIVRNDGVLVTNKHVLAKGEGVSYKVVLSDGEEYRAESVYEDPFDDIAFLKVIVDENASPIEFKPVEFADSDVLRVGQKVLAFGNALSEYQNTVTMGIISGKGRQIVAKTGAGIAQSESLSGLLQTDAAINFGNSGGPLVDLDGKVVGMNVALDEGANGIGFAIPSNDLVPLVESMNKNNGEVLRPMLGVRFIMLNKNQAKKYETGIDHGALLVGNVVKGELAVIAGSSADEAGLKALDVILTVDGKDVTEERPLNALIKRYQPGDKIVLEVFRAGKTISIDLVLKSVKDM